MRQPACGDESGIGSAGESGATTGYLATFEPAMRLALELAAGSAPLDPAGRPAAVGEPGPAAAGEEPGTSGVPADVPVGAVVLGPDGAVAGRGRNQCIALGDPTAHAEIVAIRQAARELNSWRLDGCTLVVTLEPCTMCAGALLSARIRRLVYAAADPRSGAAGSLWDVVRDPRLGPPVEVLGGLLADDSAALLADFFRRLR